MASPDHGRTATTNTPDVPTIAIVGGGFSGTMVAVQLLRRAVMPLRLVLIERDDAPGCGVAYRDQPECHLLNVRAEAMSAFADAPDHFLDWLNRCYSPCHPVGTAEYLPRRLYGAYLEATLGAARAAARPGVTIESRHDEVCGLAAFAGDGARLQLASGATLTADQMVLAIGNPGPADPPVADAAFYASRRYHGHAWSAPGLATAGSDERILLVGSGLTALDALAALQDRGHRGAIDIVSRRGLLPQPQRPAAALALGFDPLALPPRVAPLLRALRTEIARIGQAGGDWRSAIDALRPWTQRLWRRLPDSEQRRFLRHLRPHWDSHRHRAAPRTADIVQELLRRGQLRTRAGRLVGFVESPRGVEVRLCLRGSGRLESLSVDRVVNCTGSENSDRRLDHPLLCSLRAQGLIGPDLLGLGLSTDDHGALRSAAGTLSAWLHTLGPTRKGQLWETTAVPEIRVQAQALALRLLRTGGAVARMWRSLDAEALTEAEAPR